MPAEKHTREQKTVRALRDLGFVDYLRETGVLAFAGDPVDGVHHLWFCPLSKGKKKDERPAAEMFVRCETCAEQLPRQLRDGEGNHWQTVDAIRALTETARVAEMDERTPADKVARGVSSLSRLRETITLTQTDRPAARKILALLDWQITKRTGGPEGARQAALAKVRAKLAEHGVATVDETPVLLTFPSSGAQPWRRRCQFPDLYAHCKVDDGGLWLPRFATQFVLFELGELRVDPFSVHVAECESKELAASAHALHVGGGVFADLPTAVAAARDALA